MWRDQELAYWGGHYLIDGTIYFQPDLSSTFHMVKYLNGSMSNMEQVGLTTLAMKNVSAPYGWYDIEGEPFNHNNYDIVSV